MKKHSKFMSLILRHKPEVGNLTLDKNGYAKVSDVLRALREHVGPINREELDQLVAENDKQRFAFNDHRDKIRASQGHSIAVGLDLEAQAPPAQLYHGTKSDFLDSIFKDGLVPRNRQHVHLSKDVATAQIVANRRRGSSVILAVDTTKVDGPFYLSANGVWLVDHVQRRRCPFTVRHNK